MASTPLGATSTLVNPPPTVAVAATAGAQATQVSGALNGLPQAVAIIPAPATYSGPPGSTSAASIAPVAPIPPATPTRKLQVVASTNVVSVAQQSPKPVPQEAPKPVPQEAPKAVPQEAPKVVPQEAPKRVPQEAPKQVPQEAPKPVLGPPSLAEGVAMSIAAAEKTTVNSLPTPPRSQADAG